MGDRIVLGSDHRGFALKRELVPRLRTALVHELEAATIARPHNDANVFALDAEPLAEDA